MGKPEPLPGSGETAPEQEEVKSKEPKKRKTKAELFPKNLPVVEKITLIPAEVSANPDAYKCIGERHHDELDYQPARLRWERTIIPSYVLKNDKAESPVREKAPVAKIPGAMITPALASALIIDKHCDHIPHYRQSQRFFREQTVDLSRKTINTWVHQAATHLTPVAEAIGRELRSSDLLQMDETPMHYLSPGTGKAQKGYIWVMRDPQTGATYYQWQKGRSAQDLFQTLGYDEETHTIDFKGIIQCDGYSCYLTLMNTYEGIKLGACLAHIRRKFIDDESLRKIPWVSYLLRAIKVLYRIERRLRKTSELPDVCKRIRQRHAKPIVEKLHQLLTQELPQHRPTSSCGKAISYALNQWSQFILYLEDGRLAIDNNGIENAIRPCKLGLKNYMFFGSLSAGQNNATLYTLIENCKANDLNPRDYLEYVLENLSLQSPEELTPSRLAQKWAKNNKAA
jgi:transposase